MLTLERPRAVTSSAVEAMRSPKPPRTRLRRVLVGIVIAVATVASALAVPTLMGLFPSVYSPPLPEGAAFAVGNRVVTAAEYDKRLKTIEALYGAQAPADPAGADRFRRDAAKAMAVADVMANAEADRNIVIPDTKVRQQLTDMISAQYGPGPDGEQKFVTALGQVGSSEPEVLDEVRQQYAAAELIKQVTDPVQVPDSDLPAEFPKYAARLGTPEQRKLSNIVVPTQDQANDILNQLRGGAPFADLARTQSLDGATKAAGGDLGDPVTADKLQQSYAQAAFAAPQGQPFGPVQTSQGWNVGEVTQILPGKPADFAQSQIPLKQAVTNDRKIAAWSSWLQDQLRSQDVRYADAYRPADPDGAPAGLGGTPGQ
ncbi:peptidylprolyl isomerase [Actinomycetospora sp. TBRC 11914]|uniref:peptidylprolyl isomerase n=1 Tax=Actinomycetospora sp. TBRC 11914 TaxID=2729387 RepID=UPI00145F4C99|nr:peptidylprolyl isomerase [Actinomycetospora sp. TBRC 11914]NMO92275.1 parvulin peptidyl-prolyl isomerase [Actinomycetospora sp. TBRC 11914]